MSLSKHEFTNAGRSMLGRAQNGETLTITKIVVGSGPATTPSQLWPLTALIAQEMNIVISSQRDFGNGTLLVEGNFRSDAAPHVFDLREVGVMAHCAAEADRLYSVANVYTDTPLHIDPAAPVITAFKIKLIVDRIPSANVVVQIGPSEAITGENVGADTVGPGWYKEAIGNVMRFKRAVQGPGIMLTEDLASNTITIGAAILTHNLDLYVPTTYPGIVDLSLLFPTIQAAHDYLLTFAIPTNRTATIHVDAGNFSPVTPTVFSHPNSAQISVIGRDPTMLRITGTITVTPLTAPDFDVTVNVTPTTAIAVNDVVLIYNAPHLLLEQCGWVVSKTASTVKIRLRSAHAISSIVAGVNTQLFVFPTQYAGNLPPPVAGVPDVVFTFLNGIGLFKNFAIRNPLTPHSSGVGSSGNATFENIIVTSSYYGIGCQQYSLVLNPIVAACGCAHSGLNVGPAGSAGASAPTTFDRVVFSGNTVRGLYIVQGNYGSGGGVYTYLSGNSQGIFNSSGWIGCGLPGGTTGGVLCSYNTNGIVTNLLSTVLFTYESLNAVSLNDTLDISAATGSQVNIAHNNNITGNYSPARNTLGVDGAYIQVTTP